ncbi:MFS transporter [Neisseria perflava]|uniref:MFS transporter n=2 Tax=Neisseria perflava TaxID=33053 RepID=UPI0020A0E6CA|nr:MFS transporter [Neisseria perflava]MCP1660739.1 MFS family permease [Neisseria perflava]
MSNDLSQEKAVKKLERYRWVVWWILGILYIFVSFHRMSAGVIKNDLQQTFNIGTMEFANISAMFFYAYFLMQIPSGILADKFGPKKTVMGFTLISIIGTVLFSMAPNLEMVYLARFLIGVGLSVIFICLIKLQTNWFYSRNFALMIGFSGNCRQYRRGRGAIAAGTGGRRGRLAHNLYVCRRFDVGLRDFGGAVCQRQTERHGLA